MKYEDNPFAHVREHADKRPDRIGAYTVWFMVGILGAHRFHLGRPWTGLLMLAAALVSAALFFVSMKAGQAAAVALTVWWAVDGVLILKWVPAASERPTRPA